MKCETCKKEVSKFARVCEHCGTPIKIEGSYESTYYFEDITGKERDQQSEQKGIPKSSQETEDDRNRPGGMKKPKTKMLNKYKVRIACASLSIVILLSVFGIRSIVTESVSLGNSPIIYTTSNQLICYDEKTKSEKVLATGSFENLFMSNYGFFDEKVKMDSIYYITEDEKKMVYRGNDKVSEGEMGNENSISYDLYQVKLTSKAKPVLIASDVAEHRVLTDKYVLFSYTNDPGEVYLYNIETKKRIESKMSMDIRLSQDENYALMVDRESGNGLVMYRFPEMEELTVLEEEFARNIQVSPDFSKLLYLNSNFELCLVTNLENKEVIAENVSNFTVDVSKEEMEVFYMVSDELKRNAYDSIEDQYYEQDSKLSKPILKDGQLENDPEYVMAMEAYEEKLDRDALRTELKAMEYDLGTSSLYQYRQGEYKKLLDDIYSIGNNSDKYIMDSSFIQYCIGVKNRKMEIDWSESATDIYDQLVIYYQFDLGQRNAYLFGKEGLIDLGEYEVVSTDREEEKMNLASYIYDGDTKTLEKIKQVSYREDSLVEELIAKDKVPLNHTVDYVNVNGLLILANDYTSGIYYDVDETNIILDGYIPASCKMASEDKTIYYLAEGRENGRALYQIDQEKKEPVLIAEQVVAFHSISKTEVIVLCKEEGSEEGTLYRFKGSMEKQEIANNVTTFPGYMWE